MPGDRDEPAPVATRLTAPGRGAVATVRVQGPPEVVERAGFRAADGTALVDRAIDRIVYGQWGDEDVVVCRTSPTMVEVHCHGGDAAVGSIEEDLRTAGCEIVPWAESAERRSRLDRELLETLTRATTVRTATHALAQWNGALRAEVSRLVGLVDDPTGFGEGLDRLLESAAVGLHLATPWRVVLVGRPNVGKSSLVNALLGYGRAIVFDQPGTTRDVVTGETAFDGWPVTLADTAGLRETADALEAAGVERARTMLATADLCLALVDSSVPATEDDELLIVDRPDAITVAHKSDLPRVWTPPGAILVSSRTGEGVDDLIAAICERLVPNAPPTDAPLLVTQRQREVVQTARTRIDSGDAHGAADVLRVGFEIPSPTCAPSPPVG